MDSPEGIGAGEAGGRGWHGHPVHPSHLRWPGTPTAVLEGGAHKRSAVGRIAPKGRTGPTVPARRRPPDVRERALPPRRPPASPRRHPAVTCGRTEKGDIVPAQGQQDMAGPAGERKGPISFVGRDGRTWRDLQENEKGRYRSAGGARGAEGCFVRRGGRATPGGTPVHHQDGFTDNLTKKRIELKGVWLFLTIFVGLLFLRCAIS